MGRSTIAVTTFLSTLLIGFAAWADPQPETGWRMPRDVSTEGWRTDWLINITIVFVAILFAIMVVWMLWSSLRHGRRHTAEHSTGDSKRSIYAKLGVAAAIFLGVDGNLFVHSTRDMHETYWNFARVERDPRVLRIEINAHQWAWDARYAGPDGRFNTPDDIVMLNDIRVPVDTPVTFQLGSTDVVHSFYIPNLRVKQDVVPGSITRAWFQANQTGEFDVACAQHCGVNHYKMKARLTVLSRGDYENWAQSTSATQARAYDPNDTDAHWGWTWRAPNP